jgi:HD-GYP domain-containing protein (c-di-GMP phosphodiesterase class II)
VGIMCPDGLAGQQIPMGARMIAVCDAFTAMTFPRPYAAQLTVAEAFAELRRGAGTQFDPAVLDALSNFVIRLEWPPNAQVPTPTPTTPIVSATAPEPQAPPAPIGSGAAPPAGLRRVGQLVD